jgi:uncharacterized protein YecA (UPF0149 family)
MRMIFGGHVDKHDYHLVGLNEDFLTGYLKAAGFVKARRVQEFRLFDDTSSMSFKGVLISLNMIAEKRVRIEANGDPGIEGTGRNQPCSCGSGKKFKHCHGKLS